MPFEIKTGEFAGPLHLLLEIVEREELDITEVSLAKVADEYLDYVTKSEVPAEELADFLVVASRLLYIKSRAILPDFELEEEEGDLTAQLKMYREFVEASKVLYEMYRDGRVMYAREKPPRVRADFFPPKKLTPTMLETTMRAIIKKLEPFLVLKQANLRRVVSIQERIKNIHDALLSRSQLRFNEIISSGASKVDVIVNFLALLELVKQRIVSAAQGELFEDINIKRID